MSEWISWFDHPVPEDVRGILIKYSDGVFSDRYDHETGKRKYREGQSILGWKFMERRDPNIKSVKCIDISKEHSFLDVINGLLEGKEYRRPSWRKSRKSIWTFADRGELIGKIKGVDLIANDWIEVSDE